MSFRGLTAAALAVLVPALLAASSCGTSGSTLKSHVADQPTVKEHQRGEVAFTVDWGECLVSVIPLVGDAKYIVEFPNTLKKLQFVNPYESSADLYLALRSFPFVYGECWPTSPSPLQSPAPGAPPSQSGAPPGPSSTPPAWAGTLGAGVMVEPPSAGVGDDAIFGYINGLLPQDAPASCQFVVPSSRSACQSVLDSSAQNGTFVAVTYQSIEPGYAAVDGDEALVVFDYAELTVQVGIQENLLPDNNDPAALLDSGNPFTALWAEATSGANNEIELIPLLKVNGTWYVDYSQFPYPRYS
jgi:hypothetical protein